MMQFVLKVALVANAAQGQIVETPQLLPAHFP
jgi:hypothetical protein